MIAFCKYVKGINTWGKKERAVRQKIILAQEQMHIDCRSKLSWK